MRPEVAPRRLACAIAAGLMLALVTACGGGSPGSRSATVAGGDQDMLEFVRCMRAHHVDMRDPFHRPGHSGLSIDLPTQDPATAAAYMSCGHYLQPIVAAKESHTPAITEAVRLGLIHYAQCMRNHAVPMLDPSPQGALSLGNVPGIATGFGRYSPQFRSADRACRQFVPASIHDDGSGP